MFFFCVAQIFLHGDNWSSGPITAPGASISPDDGPCLCPRVQPMGCLLCFPPAYQQQTQSCWRQMERWSFSNFVFFFNYPNFFLCLKLDFVVEVFLKRFFKFLVRIFTFFFSVGNEFHRYESDGRRHARRRSPQWVSQKSKGRSGRGRGGSENGKRSCTSSLKAWK